MKSVGISFGIGALVSATFSKSFGTANKGISQLSNTIGKLNQEIVNHLQERLTVSPREITVVITGVKSENVSARNMEFKFKYADK